MTKKNIITIILAVMVAASVAAFYFEQKETQNIENNKSDQVVETLDNNAVVVEQNGEVVATTSIETVDVAAEAEADVPVPAKQPTADPVPKTPTPTPVVTKPAEPAPAPALPSGITMAEVRTHTDASSCWSVVNGSVYDLTSYVPKHPGGKGEILAICGKDGSSAFEGQHGGESKPERILASYKIGDLSN